MAKKKATKGTNRTAKPKDLSARGNVKGGNLMVSQQYQDAKAVLQNLRA